MSDFDRSKDRSDPFDRCICQRRLQASLQPCAEDRYILRQETRDIERVQTSVGKLIGKYKVTSNDLERWLIDGGVKKDDADKPADPKPADAPK